MTCRTTLLALTAAACTGAGGPGGRPATPVLDVSIDSDGGCAIDARGRPWCWGDADALFPGETSNTGNPDYLCVEPFLSTGNYGYFGICASDGPKRPALLADAVGDAPLREVSVAAGYGTCVLAEDGRVWCGPAAVACPLGCPNAFEVVSGELQFATIDASGMGWCGVTVDGEGWCYATGNKAEPRLMPIPGGHVFERVTAGAQIFVGLDDAGAVWKGGLVQREAYSADVVPSDPALLVPGDGYEDARAAASYARSVGNSGPVDANACVLDAAGTVTCFGGYFYVAAGVVPGITATAVAVGDSHACALNSSGAVWCWGSNGQGELGGPTTEQCDLGGNVWNQCSATPVQVPDLPPATRIWAGNDLACAEVEDGGVWCWGNNDRGQLGDVSKRLAPRQVIAP